MEPVQHDQSCSVLFLVSLVSFSSLVPASWLAGLNSTVSALGTRLRSDDPLRYDNTFGIDIDTFDIAQLPDGGGLSNGDREITLSLSSGGDIFLLGPTFVSITTSAADDPVD